MPQIIETTEYPRFMITPRWVFIGSGSEEICLSIAEIITSPEGVHVTINGWSFLFLVDQERPTAIQVRQV